mmetsp:Transcript_1458/g.2117  ORF Transcript_1458/g.2117 Transcript_1458/m.2117 type:complete len:336 (-) Transcript_1458:695-1702(-)
MKLVDHLRAVNFSLHLSCSFFGYFAHSGALLALEEAGIRPQSVGGSSAGAVVAAMLAVGYSPSEMHALFNEISFSDIFTFRPRLYWGSPGFALFRQNLGEIENRVLKDKPRRLEDCQMPVALSVQDVTTGKGRVLRSGQIAPAVAASAAVPVLMHAVKNPDDGHLFLDGGLSGDVLGVAGANPDDHILVINLFLRAFIPKTPSHLTKAVIVDLYGVPFVTPNSLHTTGPIAHRKAYEAMKLALNSELPESIPRRMSVKSQLTQGTEDTAAIENKNISSSPPGTTTTEKSEDLSFRIPSSPYTAPTTPVSPNCKNVHQQQEEPKTPHASWFDLWRS